MKNTVLIPLVIFINFIVTFSQPKQIIFMPGDTMWVYPTDNHGEITWYSTYDVISQGNGAFSDSNGYANTKAVVATFGPGSYPAYICDTLAGYGYTDWYLPSRDELNFLYDNQTTLACFSQSTYWSSTIDNIYQAYMQFFPVAGKYAVMKNETHSVHCIRRPQMLKDLMVRARVFRQFYTSAKGEIDVSVYNGSGFFTYQWSNGATSQDISNLNDGSYSLTVTDTQTAKKYNNTYLINTSTPVAGLLFYNDDTLMVNPNYTWAQWGPYGTDITAGNGASSTTDGIANTSAIVSQLGTGCTAYICDTMTAYGNTDWYLPAIDELQAIYNNRNALNVYQWKRYWSSTEYNSWLAKRLEFMDGTTDNGVKDSYEVVRCITNYKKLTSDILNNSSDNDLLLFPNPASSYIEIITSKPVISVSLLNSNGQPIQTIRNNNQVMLNGIPAGIYIMLIETDNYPVVRKFVVQ